MKLNIRKDVPFLARIPVYLYERMLKEKIKSGYSINLQVSEALKEKYGDKK